MAGFQVPSLVIIFEFVLLTYIVLAASAISLVQPLAINQSATFLNTLDLHNLNNPNNSNSIIGFQANNMTTFNTLDINGNLGSWNITPDKGLYPYYIDSYTKERTIISNKPATSIEFGNVMYSNINNTQYNTIRFVNLANYETDILICVVNNYYIKTTYYYLSFYNGLSYISSLDTYNILGGQVSVLSNSFLLSVPITNDAQDIKYELNYNNGLINVYTNNNLLGNVIIDDLIERQSYALQNNHIKIITDNLEQYGYGLPYYSGLNILTDYQHHVIDNFNSYSNDMDKQIAIQKATDYNSISKIFYNVITWQDYDLPWYINLPLIIIPELVFLLILVLIGLAIIVSWIP